MRTLLLGTLLAATLCDVFLRPKLPVVTVAGVMEIHSHHRESKQDRDQTQSTIVADGVWQLQSRNGRLLADGAYDMGMPVGHWRYYDRRGRVTAEGQCEAGHAVGPWIQRSRDGTISSAATLAVPAPATLFKTDGRLAYRLGGGATVFSSGADLRASTTSQRPLPELLQQLAQSPYGDRCQALHELAHYGPAALPSLLEVMASPEHPARRQVLRYLENQGTQVVGSAGRLKAIAESNEDPLSPAIWIALLAIDPAQSRDYLGRLLEHVAVHHTLNAAELEESLAHYPSLTVQNLAAYLHDDRTVVRRLVVGLLICSLQRYCSELRWHTRDFLELVGLERTTNGEAREDDIRSSTAIDTETHGRAIFDQLEKLQQDEDGEIQEIASKVLQLWRAKVIVIDEFSFGFSCFGGGYF